GTPGLGVGVEPAFMVLTPRATARVTVSDPGTQPVAVSVCAAGYVVNRAGQVVAAPGSSRSARPWLRLSPRAFVLAPRQRAEIAVRADVPRSATPGDHHALVEVRARSLVGGTTLGSTVQIGVNTVVRTSGPLVRDLVVHRLSVHRSGGLRVLRLSLSNRG